MDTVHYMQKQSQGLGPSQHVAANARLRALNNGLGQRQCITEEGDRRQRLQQAFDGACPTKGHLLHVGLILLGHNNWGGGVTADEGGATTGRGTNEFRLEDQRVRKTCAALHASIHTVQVCGQYDVSCECKVHAKCTFTFMHLQHRRHGR